MRVTKAVKPSGLPDQLLRVQRRLEDWRQTRQRRGPIPEALWMESVDVARDVGLNLTARVLRLNYQELKKRLPVSLPTTSCEPRFVELVAPPSRVGVEYTVEMEHPGGASLRIHLKGAEVPDWSALSQAFWSVAR